MIREEPDRTSSSTLYPLELQCDTRYTDESKSNDELDINPQETQLDSTLNVDVKEYKPNRTTVDLRIFNMTANEHIEPYVK